MLIFLKHTFQNFKNKAKRRKKKIISLKKVMCKIKNQQKNSTYFYSLISSFFFPIILSFINPFTFLCCRLRQRPSDNNGFHCSVSAAHLSFHVFAEFRDKNNLKKKRSTVFDSATFCARERNATTDTGNTWDISN